MTYTYQTESARLEELLTEEVACLLTEWCDDPAVPYHVNFSDLAGWLPDKIGARVAYVALRRAGFTPTIDDSAEGRVWDRHPEAAGWKKAQPVNLEYGDLDLQIDFAARAIMGGAL